MDSPGISIDRLDRRDPVEDVLTLAGAHVVRTATFSGRGAWAAAFPPPAGAKFNAVVEGACVLEVAGGPPINLVTGDVFLLTQQVTFVLRGPNATGVAPVPVSPYYRASEGHDAEIGDEGSGVTARLIGGSVHFSRRARELLLDALPPVVHLPVSAPAAAGVLAVLSRIDVELQTRQLGWQTLADRLAAVLLIELLRFSSGATGVVGWLRGLDDRVVGTMLRAIHAAPERKWTVQLLATVAHVSRATAAARFKRVVGTGPLEYARRWRMELAAHRLATTSEPTAQIAREVGYGSETALGLAFKQHLGTTPAGYRRASQRPVLARGQR